MPSLEAATKAVASLSDDEVLRLSYDWYGIFAREKQKPPDGDWLVWFLMAGRGFGKSRSGAEWIRSMKEAGYRRMALVAPTSADTRDVMVEGESGVLAISPPWDKPLYEPSKRRLTWNNGAIATLYSAEEPDRLNGPQHDKAWCDEIGVWKYGKDTWDMLMFGLRLGDNPQVMITSTPKVQNISLIKAIIKKKSTVVVSGSTYENLANLAPSFKETVLDQYEGTRLGRQELHAELLDDVPGALWQRSVIDQHRVKRAPKLKRVVVAIDPAATNTEESDETGIVVAGLGYDGHAYVLADRTRKDSPVGWARTAIAAYEEFEADRIVAEVNNGGDMVEAVLRSVDESIPYRKIHASRGKRVRAEPISSKYEQGKVHHAGTFDRLEDQMCSFTPEANESPDRMDALVWALTELMLGKTFGVFVSTGEA